MKNLSPVYAENCGMLVDSIFRLVKVFECCDLGVADESVSSVALDAPVDISHEEER